jgi:hypothetical protein
MPQGIVDSKDLDLVGVLQSRTSQREKVYEPLARTSLDILERSKAPCMRSSTACDRSESSP